jgi:hypothetical protein
MTWLEFLQSLWTPEVATTARVLIDALILALLARLGMRGTTPPPTAPAPAETPTPPQADPLAEFPVLRQIAGVAKAAIPGTVDDILLDAAARVLDRVRRQRQGQTIPPPPVPAIGKADDMGLTP